MYIYLKTIDICICIHVKKNKKNTKNARVGSVKEPPFERVSFDETIYQYMHTCICFEKKLKKITR